jgi:prophage antirepressor-like protein
MKTQKSLERIFNFQSKQVRTVPVDGEPWFVAKDVCEVLGIRTNTVRFILEEDEVQEFNPNDNSNDIGCGEAGRGGRNMLAVSEPGLYSLILRSRKPVAKEFRRWITHEVIPSLRRTGGYLQSEDMPVRAGKLLQFSRRDLLNLAVEAENECEGLSAVVAELAPKAEFYDRVADTSASFSLGETAKMLEIPGFGRNNLIRYLRSQGVLMADNVAKQRYIERGYFHIVQSEYFTPDGTPRVTAVTRVYEKGVDFIRRLMDNVDSDGDGEYLTGDKRQRRQRAR